MLVSTLFEVLNMINQVCYAPTSIYGLKIMDYFEEYLLPTLTTFVNARPSAVLRVACQIEAPANHSLVFLHDEHLAFYHFYQQDKPPPVVSRYAKRKKNEPDLK